MAPGPLLEIWGLQAFRAVEGAVRIGLFDALGESSSSIGRLARRLGADEEGIRLHLRALEGLGYVIRVPGGYALSPMARKWIGKGAVRDLSPLFRFWGALEDGPFEVDRVVREGRPAERLDEWTKHRRDVGRADHAARAALDSLAAIEIGRRVPWATVGRVLEVGSGSGMLTRHVLTANPAIEATVHTHPGAEHVVGWNLEEAGLAGRVELMSGEAARLRATPDHDAAIMCHALRGLDDDEVRAALERVLLGLRRGGHIAIFEALDLPAVPSAASAANRLQALSDFCLGRPTTVTTARLVAMMRDIGYVAVRQRRVWTAGGTLIIARRSKRGRPRIKRRGYARPPVTP